MEDSSIEPIQHEAQNSSESMKVLIIAAIGLNNEIGRHNDLMWHLGEDMRFFKEQTNRHYIIMGRKNFESIPEKYRPLPNRINVIISRDPDYLFEECYTCSNLDDALDLARGNGEEKVYIIGGGQIYKLALDANLVDEMYLTHVKASFPDADVFFPEFESSQWSHELIKNSTSGIENEFDFEIFHYKKK